MAKIEGFEFFQFALINFSGRPIDSGVDVPVKEPLEFAQEQFGFRVELQGGGDEIVVEFFEPVVVDEISLVGEFIA